MQYVYLMRLILSRSLIFVALLSSSINSFSTIPQQLQRQQIPLHHVLLQQQHHHLQQPSKLIKPTRCSSLQATTVKNSNGPISLKLVAIPLLDAGKALARTGELIIDLTSSMDLYGGALSSFGANLRNAGDNIAQAAASCRFKTANELVIDEIREASSSLVECSVQLQRAIDEAKTDKNTALALCIESMEPHVKGCSISLETAGASLLQRQPLSTFGKQLISAGEEIASLAPLIQSIPNENGTTSTSITSIANEASQRCQYASKQMILAGTNLCYSLSTSNSQATGKSWLKGGN